MPKRTPSSVASSANDACPFCTIASGSSDVAVVFDDAISFAFLDFRPLFPGHCLLIPKSHYEAFSDLPANLIGLLFSNAQLLARAVQDAMQADGTFLAMNNTVSQSVPHFHIHVVPRRRGDGLRGFFWPRTKYKTPEEMLAVQRAIASRLKS